MSDVILRLEHVGKMYHIFHDKKSRILSLLNFPVPKTKYEEFWALRNISFELKQGERLGLVGRNGAGKSTMLKLIAGIIKPTIGSVESKTQIQALLEIGTGFHPEFTGKQNILSSLGYYGITGKKAANLFDEIIDFSELENFIDSPIKTYSSGMYSRLAFSISTAIIKSQDKPSILIIDEILGAGDAYFSAKCSVLMKDLTQKGASVLFVSHDISAVQMICNRAIWIERGSILMEGEPLEVSKEYANSIRRQEDLRIRALNMKVHRHQAQELNNKDTNEYNTYVLRFTTHNNNQPVSKHVIYEISLYLGNDLIDSLRLGEPQDNDPERNIYLLTTKGLMNWSEPLKIKNTLVRSYSNFKGKYVHAPFVIKVQKIFDSTANLKLVVKHRSSEEETINIDLFHNNEYVRIGTLNNTGTETSWHKNEFNLSEKIHHNAALPVEDPENIENVSLDSELGSPIPNKESIYGDSAIVIKNVKFCNINGENQGVYSTHESMSVHISWESKKYHENLIFVVCIYALDGRVASQVLSEPVNLNNLGYLSGETRVTFNPLLIGEGDYVVSIGIFTDNNPQMFAKDLIQHCVIDREYQLKIRKPENTFFEYGAVFHPVAWSFINREALDGYK